METSQSFIEHLEELRKRILLVIGFWVAGSVIVYFFSKQVLDYLILPLKSFQEKPIFTRPVEPFMAIFKICVFGGGILTLPNTLIQIWLFIKPALMEKEKKVIKFMLSSFFFFFLAGMSFAFYLIVPLGLKVLFSFGKGSLKPLISIGSYLNFLLIFMTLLGLVFNLPVIIGGLSSLGIINPGILKEKRKFAFVGAFIISAILTPTTDIFTQIFVAIPLIFLYEISILFSKIFKK